jgi:hypothetical protein
MTALYITIQEPSKLQIDNLCREDATEREKQAADAIEKLIKETLLEKPVWELPQRTGKDKL